MLDFGIARISDPTATRLTSADILLGTPRYMAPEQRRGEDGEGDDERPMLRERAEHDAADVHAPHPLRGARLAERLHLVERTARAIAGQAGITSHTPKRPTNRLQPRAPDPVGAGTVLKNPTPSSEPTFGFAPPL